MDKNPQNLEDMVLSPNFRGFLGVAAAIIALLLPNTSRAGWETLADAGNFSSRAAFEQAYGYNYPGNRITHNGDCIMDPTNVVLSGGTVGLRCTRFSGAVVNGNYYDYTSGTFYWKQAVVFDAKHPAWDVSVTCQIPYIAGTWPAFWLTPTNKWNCESDIMESWGVESIRHGTYGPPPGAPGRKSTWAKNHAWKTRLIGPQKTAVHTYRLLAFKVNDTDVEFHYFQDGVQIYAATKANFVNNPLWVIFDYETFRDGNGGAGGIPTFTGPLWVRVQSIDISDLNLTGTPAGPISN